MSLSWVRIIQFGFRKIELLLRSVLPYFEYLFEKFEHSHYKLKSFILDIQTMT